MYKVLLPLNAYEKLPYYTDGRILVTESIDEEFIELPGDIN